MLNIINRPDTDLFEVRNIDGLGAVKATVNTVPFGSVDGESFVGTNVGKRNIVLTLGLDPDWDNWTISKLRRLLDRTFMPQQSVTLQFESMEFSPVEISGWIESNEPNMFSKDPEQQISIICPDLYFKSIDAVVISGQSDQIPWPIDYEGNVETGLNVRVSKLSGTDPTNMRVKLMDPNESSIFVTPTFAPVDANHDLFVNTVPGNKYIQRISNNPGVATVDNLLSASAINPRWLKIGPGTDTFQVIPDQGVSSWVLTYWNLFGSL